MRDDHSHFVVLEGFEPSQTEPESGVLPLHHRTIFICVAKVIHFLEMASDISYFLFRFARFLAISRDFSPFRVSYLYFSGRES